MRDIYNYHAIIAKKPGFILASYFLNFPEQSHPPVILLFNTYSRETNSRIPSPLNSSATCFITTLRKAEMVVRFSLRLVHDLAKRNYIRLMFQ